MIATSPQSLDVARVVLADPAPTSASVAGLASATVADATRLVVSACEREWAADAVPEGLIGELERRAQRLDDGEAPASVATPGFYQWYFTLLRAAFDGDRAAVRLAIAAGPGTHGYRTYEAAVRVPVALSTAVKAVHSSDVVARAARDYSADYTAQYGRETVIEPLPPAAYEPGSAGTERVERLGAAIDLLRDVWPEAADTLNVCTVDVALMTGPYFVGGSDLACFGTSFLNLRTDWSALCYADHLLHEAAHQAMHAFGEIHPPLRNPDTVGRHSPIRPDPRPLYGTLHATIVFSWLVELCLRVLAAPPDGSTRDEAELRLHRHLLGLYDGVRSLDQNADWTPAGERLRDRLTDRVQHLQSEVGEPDPARYEQVPDDYERPSAITARRNG
jgi:hypothetical protein